MKRWKRNGIIGILAAAAVLGTAGCGNGAGGSFAESPASSASSAAPASSQAVSAPSAIRPDDGKKLGYQLEKPQEGEEIAVIETSLGTIRIRLFPEAAPKTVENFKGLVRKGYYNGLLFHRVMKNFMVQGGDPTGTGSGGESIWGKPFADEFCTNLVNLRGSLAMANSGANTNGSQFFINQAGPVAKTSWSQADGLYQQLESYDKSQWPAIAQQNYTILNTGKLTDAYRALYEKQGGNPFLDGAYNAFDPPRGHAVFGQVFSGMDIVDKIAAVPVDSANKPTTDVKMRKVTLEKYQKS